MIKTLKQKLEYEIIVFLLYIIGITITASMKVILPLYICFSLLPFLSGIGKIKKEWIIFVLIYLIYMIYGIAYQDARGSYTTFFGKFYQFIVFFIVYSIIEKEERKTMYSCYKIMLVSMLIEGLIAAYLLKNGSYEDRLTSGRQPVGGNIFIALLPVFISEYFSSRTHHKAYMVLLSLFSGAIIVLSGTRGYMLLFFLSMSPIYFDFFFLKNKNSYHGNSRLLLNIFLLTVFVFLLYIVLETDILHDYIRLESGVGGRGTETDITLDYFNNAPLTNKLFGLGFGVDLAKNYHFLHSVDIITDSEWGLYNYSERFGAPFHNLFNNIIITQGFLGIICFIMLFFSTLKAIVTISIDSKYEKLSYILFWIGFIIMNVFRWSCDCGITEMLILGIIVGQKKAQSNNKYAQASDTTALNIPI